MRNIIYLACFVTALLLSACGEAVQKPAPLGDYAVLEQLADAYRSTGEQYSVQPQAMTPSGRREFLVRLFAQAGYGYSETLLAVADSEVVVTNQDHRDLLDLLLLPTRGLNDADLASIYRADEQQAVQRLRTLLR